MSPVFLCSIRQRRSFSWPSLLGVVLLLVLGGCPKTQPSIPKLQGLSPEDLFARIQREGEKTLRVVGFIELNYLAFDGFFHGQADLAVERPDRIRVELRSFFGQPTGALAANGDHFVFVDNSKTKALRGPTDSPELSQLLPLGLPLTASVAAMLGGLPPLADGQIDYTQPLEHGAFALQHSSDSAVWHIEVKSQDAPLGRVQKLGSDGKALLDIRYKEHKRVAGTVFPTSGTVQLKGQKGSIEWRWISYAINGETLPQAAWSLNIPPGYNLREIDH